MQYCYILSALAGVCSWGTCNMACFRCPGFAVRNPVQHCRGMTQASHQLSYCLGVAWSCRVCKLFTRAALQHPLWTVGRQAVSQCRRAAAAAADEPAPSSTFYCPTTQPDDRVGAQWACAHWWCGPFKVRVASVGAHLTQQTHNPDQDSSWHKTVH